jgi:uncharacterized protein involved in outer membrane biogenesis
MNRLAPPEAVKRSRKRLRWAAIAVALPVVLLLALHVVIPRVINTGRIRGRILAGISEAVKGDVRFQEINIRLLPRPRVSVADASLSIPGTVDGKVDSLTVYPEILPLLTGSLRFSRLRLASPKFNVTLSQGQQDSAKKSDTAGPSSIEKEVVRILALAADRAPSLRIIITDGKLVLSRKDQADLSFHEIQANVSLPPMGLKGEVTSSSNLWESMSLSGDFDVDRLVGGGKVKIVDIDLEKLMVFLAPDVPVKVGGRRIDVTLDVEAKGPEHVEAEVRGTLPDVTVTRGDRWFDFRGKSFAGSLGRDGVRTEISLKGMTLESPELELSGKLLLAGTSPRISLVLTGEGISIPSARESALTMAGGIPAVQTIFSVLRDGRIPRITFKAHGDSAGDLDNLEKMVVEGSLQEGTISVPGTDFHPENVSGKVTMTKGILVAKNLEGRLGNSQVSAGRLRVDLNRKGEIFKLDTMVQADLEDVPPILKRYVKSDAFHDELSRVSDLKGGAAGRLILESGKNSFETTVDITDMDLSAAYDRTPYPVEISSGRFSYQGQKMTVGDLKGTLGGSSFSGLDVSLGLERESTVQSFSGNFSIVLDEIFPWIYQVVSPGKQSSAEPASIKGGMDLSISDLKGPPLKPREWEFDATADFKAISIETPDLPGPVELKDGNIVATEDELTFTGMGTSLLDTSLDVSGTVDSFLSGGPKVDVSLNGTMGPEAAGLIFNMAKLPSGIKVRSPVSLSGFRVEWKQGAELGIKGDYSVADGPKGSIDMDWKPDILSVKELSIEDGASRATIGLLFKGKILDLNYSGSLGFATLQSFFKAGLLPGGHINGDLHLNLPMEDPLDLTADGRLEGGDFHLPSRLDVPVGLDEFALTAAGKDLEVSSARISWQKNNLSYSGKLKLTGSEVYMDGELTADNLSLDISRGLSAKKNAMTTGEGAGEETGRTDIWSLPLRGRLKFASNRLDLTRFSFEPFNADIVFTDQAIELSVSRANVCGIAFPGTLRVTPGGSSLDLKASARGEELKPAIACLTDHQSIVTGTYDLDLEITSEGRMADLLKSVGGDFEFNARDGFIKKSGMVTGILGVLNITDVFSGKLPDMDEEGFAYKSFVLKSEIKNGSAEITEGTLDSSIMKIASHGNVDLTHMQIDLKLLAAPVKFVERFANLPVIKQIFGGTLLAVPMQVEGDLHDPKVRAVSAAAVGSRVVGIFTNTLKLPVTIWGSGDGKDH